MPDIFVLEHHRCDPPGAIATALEARGFRLSRIKLFGGEALPASPRGASAVVSMGGPMSADDEKSHPFLRAEKRFIEAALAAAVPVLGVCLGGQILASVLGGRVGKNTRKEIGFHPTSLTPAGTRDPLFASEPVTFVPFHWHGDLFDTPPGAVALACSALTPVQAFRHGESAYGIQFHLETNAVRMRAMLDAFSEELAQEGLDPAEIAREGRRFLPSMEELAVRVFGRWAEGLARDRWG